jgi:4-hydroxybenzoate polyprenyltransferase
VARAGRFGQLIRAIRDFGRLTAAGLALSGVAIGYASAGAPLRVWRLTGLLLIALAFHTVAFALNDIFDLEIDRTNPERAASPLVSGVVSVRTAAMLVGLCAGACFAMDVAFFGFSAAATGLLAVAYIGLVVYDACTKRFGPPILLEIVQGLGWGSLVLYGAERAEAVAGEAGGHASGVSVRALPGFAFVLLFVMLVNGVHGGLRDLRNDLLHKARTTAIQFGARPREPGVLIPVRLRAYAWTLQAGMAALAVVMCLFRSPYSAETAGWLTPGQFAWYVTGLAFTGFAALLCWRAFAAADEPARFKNLGAAHILVCYVPVMCLAGLQGGWALGSVAVAAMVVPMFGNPAFVTAFRAVPAAALRALRPTAWVGSVGEGRPSSGGSVAARRTTGNQPAPRVPSGRPHDS